MGIYAEKAVELFKQGFNCSQAVAGAFADKYGIERDTMMKMACSFGGGLGRMRYVCGAVSGMAIIVGLECGTTNGADRDGKGANYAKMRELAEKFEAETGSIICGDLLGVDRDGNKKETAMPDERTQQYYQKRPCVQMVQLAAEILEQEYGDAKDNECFDEREYLC